MLPFSYTKKNSMNDKELAVKIVRSFHPDKANQWTSDMQKQLNTVKELLKGRKK